MVNPKELSRLIRERKKRMATAPEQAKQMNASDAADAEETARVKSKVGFKTDDSPKPTGLSDAQEGTMGMDEPEHRAMEGVEESEQEKAERLAKTNKLSPGEQRKARLRSMINDMT
jgi:hypothetical protein